ncbi:sensor histidine kinase N-terminal domain-containing protein [Ideonella sp. 4Y16]|uniref:ATP-binding protein n=1 Tax=Ideonella alba TaxID=2824118 RepID=UPI001B39604C|nr:ATP-binding protein [Ideonella alba]MBQ0943072.1 sensor histidine kinase N-terminal domain-containing protein [Ideonella alba]
MTARSLQLRLALRTLAMVGGLWLLAALWTAWDARHELDELFDAHLSQSAALLVAQQSGGHGDDDAEAIEHALGGGRKGHPYERKVAFQVWHEGRLGAHSPNADGAPLSTLSEGFETIQYRGATWRLFAANGAEDDVQVYVAEQEEVRLDVLWPVLQGTFGPLLLVLPLVALSVWWSVRQGLAPLRELGEVLRQRAPQQLSPVALSDPAPTELQAPLDALNALLERTGRLIDGERRFTADAAHELRTPIAIVRTQAQVALGATDDAERRHALQSTIAGCDRAVHLVQQLLTLARLDGSAGQRAASVHDGAVMARRLLGELAPQALARGQTLELDAPDHCALAMDEALAAMLLRNLVDNALRYSPDGATVQVTIHAGPDGARWTVEDSGPGLSEADQARLGERFFRAGATQDQAGSGLGWSIVRRIAQAGGLGITLGRSARLGGLSVQVAWPPAA